MGQLPVIVSVLVTTRLASDVQESNTIRLPGKASRAGTEVTGAGAAPALQPSIFVVSKLPVTEGAESVRTVKVALQVLVVSQLLVTEKVTVVVPPHALGAPVLLLVIMTLQPPVTVMEFNQLVNFELIESCDWQMPSVRAVGQVTTTDGALVTVNVAVQVFGASQSLATVKVTVLLPPQAGGAPVLLLVNTALQPPDLVAVASQLAYLRSIAAWV